MFVTFPIGKTYLSEISKTASCGPPIHHCANHRLTSLIIKGGKRTLDDCLLLSRWIRYDFHVWRWKKIEYKDRFVNLTGFITIKIWAGWFASWFSWITSSSSENNSFNSRNKWDIFNKDWNISTSSLLV